MAAPVALTGAGNLTSAILHGSTSTSITVNKPANVAVGDVLIAWIASQNNSNTTPPTSTGWTRIPPAYNVTGDAGRRPSGMFALKVTDSTVLSGLPASWTWAGPTGTGRWGGIIFRVTGADLTSDPTTWGPGSYNTNSTAAQVGRDLPGLTVPSNDQLLVAGYSGQTAAVAAQSVTWSGGSITELADINSSPGGSVAHQVTSVAAESVNAGATGVRTATTGANPASASGYMVAIPSVAAPATPTATSMYLIAHRGTTSAAAANTENSVAGLDHLATLRRPVNGVEWDVRVSSDGELFMNHDADLVRCFGVSGSVETKTAAELDAIGVTRLTAGLAAIPGRGFARVNLQHYFPGSSTAAITKMLTQIAASPVASLVKIMTSISGPYAPAQFRSGGWTGPIGTYGSTSTNYAGSGDGKAADFPAYTIGWAYLPPGAYTTNRSHAQALVAGGTIKVGASTENSSTQWAQAHTDGADEMLTDDSAGFLALYEPPPPVLTAQDATHGHAVESPTLVQNSSLAATDATHAHSAENVALVQQHALVTGGATHALASDSPTLAQVHAPVVAGATHALASDSPALTQVHVLTAAGASHALTSELVALSSAGALGVQDATHLHAADQVTLTQAHFLAAQDALHGHAADAVSLTPTLAVQDATQAHTAALVAIVQVHALQVADATHAHTATLVSLAAVANLIAVDALHAHLAQAPSLTEIIGGLLDPAPPERTSRYPSINRHRVLTATTRRGSL